MSPSHDPALTRASAVPLGTDTPDAARMEAWRFLNAAGDSPAAWNRSAVVTLRRVVPEPTSRPDASRVRPPPRRRVGHEGIRVPACRPPAGVAAAVATWSP